MIDVHKARTILRQLVGNEISVVPHESGKHLVARLGLVTKSQIQAAGGSEIFVVAGGCFELYSKCPLQIQAVSASVEAAR